MPDRLDDYAYDGIDQFVEDAKTEIRRGLDRGMTQTSAVKRASDILSQFIDAVVDRACTDLNLPKE